jgi:uncharacterized protein (DUF1800 family)
MKGIWFLGNLRLARALAVTSLTALPSPIAAQESAAPSPAPTGQAVEGADRARTIHLLQRATYSARPRDIEEALRIGRVSWVERQLEPARIDDHAVAERLAAFPITSMSQAELYAAYPPPQVLRKRFGDPDSLSPELRREIRAMSPGRMAAELAMAKLTRAVYSERQLQEVMVDFWFNHFNVFFAKGADRWLVADYERTAIRPYVFGKFEDMLVATAQHPAMLFYLDNWRSSVPDSLNPNAGGRPRRQAPSEGRQRGLNENYARELLELHTLGVDGGYTQADVIDVARAFTGWTITHPRDAMYGNSVIEFRFARGMHDGGEKTVLGRTLKAGRGVEDGTDVLHLLATDAATAYHVAAKMVALLVADDPPPDLIDMATKVFLRTGGDLREVTRAILLDDRFYADEYRQAKIRSPFELVAATLRQSDAEIGRAPMLIQQFRAFQHMPYLSDVPTGYPEHDEDWVNSGAMLQRMNFALAAASGRVRGIRLRPELVLEAAGIVNPKETPAHESVHSLAVAFSPGADTDQLESIVLADLETIDPASYRDKLRRSTGLLLGSPEFQRH